MEVSCTGTARIQHKETGQIFDIACEELDWDEDGMGEGPMGTESQHKAVVVHPELGIIVWTLGEYPVGAEDYRRTDTDGHILIEDLQYHLKHEPENTLDQNSV